MRSSLFPALLAAVAVSPLLPQTPSYAQSIAGLPDNHTLQSYRKARQVLDDAIAATGGSEALAKVTTVSRVMSVKRMDPGQARSAWNGAYDVEQLPVYSRGIMTSIMDYAGNRLSVRQTDEEVPGDTNVFAEVATGDAGFSLRWMRSEKPFYAALPPGAARARIGREMRLHPEGLLKAALRQASTLAWSGRSTLDGAAVDVISFVDPQSTRVILSFDASTHLLVRGETLSDHSVLGDSTLSVDFSDYRLTGPIKLPHRVITRRNDRAARDYRLTSIALNAALDPAEFAPPEARIPSSADPEVPVLKPRGGGVYEVHGEYNVMFAAFDDYVLLIESPRDEGYARQVFDLIRTVEPTKPIKVVATHFHFDHIGGMRYAATAADEIWATADTKTEIERALGYVPTIRPDQYAKTPKPVTVRLVEKGHVFEDSHQRVEIADVGPVNHVDALLVGYFPRLKTMLVADLWDVLAPDTPLTSLDSEQLMARVKALGWKVDHMLPVHGVTASMPALERSLAARKAYLAGRNASAKPAGDR